MLPYYRMSFQYFLYLLVVSNAIGAFDAFIGGLSDKIGRANLTIFGAFIVACIQLFTIPQITSTSGSPCARRSSRTPSSKLRKAATRSARSTSRPKASETPANGTQEEQGDQ